MRDLHQNVFSSQGNGLSSDFNTSLLNSLPSDSEYTSASEWETPGYFKFFMDVDSDDTLVRALTLATDEPHISLLKDVTGHVTKLDVYPFDCGNTADIYRGELASEDSSVSMAS